MKETLAYSPSIISRKPLATCGDARLSIAVLGRSCVGKTALTVQYLTGRFIGDYCSGQDMTYRTSVPHLGGSISTPVDILDTSNSVYNEEMIEKDHSYWTRISKSEKYSNHRQAYLVVYSLTNAASFDLAKEILQTLPSRAPKFLAANQLDLQHRRQVSSEDGQALADRFDRCHFGEFSAADPLTDPHHSRHIKSAFGKLIRKLISSSPQCVIAPYFPDIFSKLMGTLAVVKTRSKQRKMLTRSTGCGGSISSTSSSSSCRSIRSCSPIQSHDVNPSTSLTSSIISSDGLVRMPLMDSSPQNSIKEQATFPISILLHHLTLSRDVLNDSFSSSYP